MTAENHCVDMLIVGTGPIGLEMAVVARQAGMSTVNFDKGTLAQTITWYPQGMSFFSSTDRIAIAGMPISTTDQTKATKEQYLAYLRSVVRTFQLDVRTYTEVDAIEKQDDGSFTVTTRDNHGEQTWTAKHVVLATGDTHEPRRLNVPGEDLPHVSHFFHHPHDYYGKKLLVVGGKNSAVEAALRCWHAGVDVEISYRGDAFNKQHVKYWLLPELLGRIHRGEIACHYRTTVQRITPTTVTLKRGVDETFDVEADFVLLMTGYVAKMDLFDRAGVELAGSSGTPVFDSETMQTRVPGLYIAGTATAGTQEHGYQVFIENCHVHTQRIVNHILGQAPPPPPQPIALPES